MRFRRFEIENFKGIESATVDLVPSGANVFTLIGLNESGKTTVLEALSTFSLVRDETGALYGAGTARPQPPTYVPKHLKSNFSGNITVTATIAFDDGEKERIAKSLHTATGARLDVETLGESFTIKRGYKFENSDFKENIYLYGIPAFVIPKGLRKSREVFSDNEIWTQLVKELSDRVPQILYFPTFLFNQPEKIILNPDSEETSTNRLYRQIVQDIASTLDNPLDVKKHIVDRILTEETAIVKMINLFTLAQDKQQQIAAALSEMSAHVTETIFDSWSKIFGGDFTGREIVLRPGVEADKNGKTLVYLQFAIKDGRQNYDIAERSLGFRWFFSFLLFTVYRVANVGRRPVLFLLDEPASNLHSRAQMQLLTSFPRVATGSNQVMYSTHSHYMINPEWLDQAFIVSNSAIDYDHPDEADKAVRSRATNVAVSRYRQFVGENPDRWTYFQPVLDKLDVVPSRLDLLRPSVLVEGKGDYLILEYGRRVILNSTSEIAVVPTRGATGMDELVGLFLGWGVNFHICLDDDPEGRLARKRYVEEWGIEDVRSLYARRRGERA